MSVFLRMKLERGRSFMTYGKARDFRVEEEIRVFLQKLISINNPDEAINAVIKYIGEKYSGDRVYIFELQPIARVSNTYEYCAEGVVPQVHLLQNEPAETLLPWWEIFEAEKILIIHDLEDIREIHPHIYASLKIQDIRSLIAAPIRMNERVIGFIGVDNPRIGDVETYGSFLMLAGHFLSFALERRNLYNELNFQSSHDQLTGAYNRYEYRNIVSQRKNYKSVGVVYCDISGLKKTNDNMGHEEGDRLIIECYHTLKTIFAEHGIYRIGGDEFVVICMDSPKTEFESLLYELKVLNREIKNVMSIGSSWSEGDQCNLQWNILKAEEKMYEDKAHYYDQMNPISKLARENALQDPYRHFFDGASCDRLLSALMSKSSFDAEWFFRSVEMTDYYPYFGDLQANLFYIGDAMKEVFGFQNNVVSDLFGIWETRISNELDLEMFREDIQSIMSKKKNMHDLRYRVRDKDGNEILVHCKGIIKWNEDQTVPLLFSGVLSRQEQNLILDPITNFPGEYAAAIKLRELQQKQSAITIIGFSLNNFKEINEIKGRQLTDVFLSEIAGRLTKRFENRLLFYRLDGMRFAAFVLPGVDEKFEDLIRELRNTIRSIYYSNNIIVRVPCSFGVIFEDEQNLKPNDALVSITALLSAAKNSPEKDYIVNSSESIHLHKSRSHMIMELSKKVINGFEDFRIVIQPTIGTDDKKIFSAEVLLRWKYEGKDVSPDIIIPILENNRLILPVGRWVFEQAVRTCKRITTFLPEFQVSVNVSYYQIYDEDFLDFIQKTLEKYQLAGERIILEITETHYDEAPKKVYEFLKSCRRLGIHVAIDDFGNAYSSLAFLLKYPAEIVKLDRSLIHEMATSEGNINFMTSIVFACHQFGKKVCAEGVETKEKLLMVVGAGCDIVQGYFFYEPMELSEFYSILPTVKGKEICKGGELCEKEEGNEEKPEQKGEIRLKKREKILRGI